ncbi:MAG TPA: hypothetical protein VFF77_05470 [Holophagaceae bacterium]|nr:hypothetical protein [Holophagaceae bacterium]
MATTLPTPSTERPGLTYQGALALLKAAGVRCSRRTLLRWVANGILSVKRVTRTTVFLFRDEIEALIAPDDPKEQRMLSVKSAPKRRK